MVAPVIRARVFPELFLGLLALALAAVWIAHVFAATIHDAKHAHDTITITGSAKKPIAADLVQWDLTVEGKAPTPVAAARRAHQAATALAAFLHEAGIGPDAIAPQVVQSDVQVTRIDKKHVRTTYAVAQGFEVSSRRIDVVERAATRLGTLLERGVGVSAQPLAYVSTNLEAAK